LTQQEQAEPTIRFGSLVILAYLKSCFDEGEDYVGRFKPLILKVLPVEPNRNFRSANVRYVQKALSATYRMAMPQEAVTRLPERAARKQPLFRKARLFCVDLGGSLQTGPIPLTRKTEETRA